MRNNGRFLAFGSSPSTILFCFNPKPTSGKSEVSMYDKILMPFSISAGVTAVLSVTLSVDRRTRRHAAGFQRLGQLFGGVDCLRRQELDEALWTMLLADAGRLHPAARRARTGAVQVHARRTGAHARRHLKPALEVLGEDRARQPVLGVVGDGDRFVHGVVRDDSDHRA